MKSRSDTQRAALVDIKQFLAEKRIAMIGISRNPQDFTRKLFEEFVLRGYDPVPVNPAVLAVGERACYSSVSAINPQVKAALLLAKPEVTEFVVRECADSGIEIVWMYRAGGSGAVSKKAVEFCRERGITVIGGECPLMFLPNMALPHRLHGFIRKICGTHPT